METTVTKTTDEPTDGFTRYGFHRIAHHASKVQSGLYWQGEITLQVEDEIVDELEAAKDMEALIRANRLPLFGSTQVVTFLDFQWASENTCLMKVGYRGYAQPMSGADIALRVGEIEGATNG